MAGKRPIQGIEREDEVSKKYAQRDVRPLSKRFKAWISEPTNMVITMSMMTGAAWYYSAVADIFALLMIPLVLWSFGRREFAPLKMPIQSGMPDPNEINPSNGKPMPAQGIFFLGNELSSGKEIWLTNDDCRQHFLVLGTTGAGKTELLIGFAANAISWGSGLLYCDGKGDVSLFAKMYALCRRWGREDDLLVINFMNGNKESSEGKGVRSNTLNPFSTGASDGLTQMIVGLMPEAGGDGAMWKGRAVSMLTGLMKALVWLRDKGERELNVSSIRDAMVLKNIIELANKDRWPNMPEPIRKSVQAYLNALPGYQESKGANQAQTTLDQHGYLQMQFSQIFGSLSDVYGHIFGSAYGQVDMNDVVLNRRILVIMLPALEKSGDEIANLGKIVTANLKGMMGQTLGATLEGDWNTVVENRPTSAPSPYLVILDEVGYYTVDGMALMAAQARSLGFSMVYASQDIPAMKRNNQKEADSIIANTNTKIFMRTEEAEQTGALAEKSAGETMTAGITEVERFENEVAGSLYRGSASARLERRKRVDFLDLKSQGSGEMTVIYKGEVVRGKAFYADPSGSLSKHSLELRANHFIEVHRPDPSLLEAPGETENCANILMLDVKALSARLAKECAEALDPNALLEAMAGGNEIAAALLTWRRAMGEKEDGTKDPNTHIKHIDPLAAGCVVVARLGSDMNMVASQATESARSVQRGPMRPETSIDRSSGLDRETGDLRAGRASESANFPDNPVFEDFEIDDEPKVIARQRVGPRPPPKTDPSVRHGVSSNGKEIWKPGQHISRADELLQCLAVLDDLDGKSVEEIDGLLDMKMGVEISPPESERIRQFSQLAADFDEKARIMEETQTDAKRPPRREPPKPVKAEDKDKGSDGGDKKSGSSSGSSDGDGGSDISDFISEILSGGSK
jgi:intracellular multiplication protein IcmO